MSAARTRRPTAPSRTRPTTVGWIAIIVFVFLAGLGADRARSPPSASTTRSTQGLDPTRRKLTDYVLPEETIVYDRTGKVELARFGDAKREVVTFDQIPKVLLDATTAVEDKTFWDNAGFDPVAIVSAGARARSAATAAARRRSPSSSSAQRLLDPALVQDPHRTAERKLKEIIQSIRLTEAFPGERGQADRSSPPT